MLGFLLDLVYPPRCKSCMDVLPLQKKSDFCIACKKELQTTGIHVCRQCGLPLKKDDYTRICHHCMGEDFFFQMNRAFFVYNDAMKNTIHHFKYDDRPEYAKDLAGYMAQGIKRDYPEETFVLVPVPIHLKKERKRGYNQAELLAKELAGILNWEYRNDILVRMKDTEKQSGLKRLERSQNLKGAFCVQNYHGLEGKKILIIDDIYTTGSTMNECAKAFLDFNNQVFGYTLSIAQDK